MVWLIFFCAAFAIFIAGNALARTGDVIAQRTRLGHIWVGALLIAGATSLPELTVDSAAILRDDPDLATGDLFGSNMANMAVLAIVALAYGRTRVLQREALGLTLTASLAIILTGLAALFIVSRLEHNIAGAVGFGSVAILVTAVIGLFLIPQYRELAGPPEAEELSDVLRLPVAVLFFVVAAAVMFIAAPVLVWSAEEISEITGLAQTFVGVVGLAVATSLPELATSASAVRMGNLDLAVGNLYGSNAMNISILVWLDLLYTKAPLLESIHITNAVAGILAVLLMMVGLASMVLRAERRRFPFDPAAALILAGYVLGMLLIWSVSET